MKVQDCCFNISVHRRKACWVITTFCNLDCNFCAVLSKGMKIRPSQQISQQVLQQVIHSCKTKEINKIVISGGEPLLVPNIVEIVDSLSKYGLRVSISTNGTLLTERLLYNLRQAGLSKFIVGVDCSKIWVDSKKDYSQYSFRIDQILSSLRKSGIPFELSIVFLPMIQERLNIVANWIRRHQPLSISLIEPQSCGKLSMPSHPDYTWDNNRLQDVALHFAMLLSSIQTVLVLPRCRHEDCPSKHVMFGISGSGTLEECPWKQYLAAASNDSANLSDITQFVG